MHLRGQAIRSLVLLTIVGPVFLSRGPAFAQVDEEPSESASPSTEVGGEPSGPDSGSDSDSDSDSVPEDDSDSAEDAESDSAENDSGEQGESEEDSDSAADDDWDLPDDLDDDDVGDFNFDDVEDEDDPLTLPLFGETTFSMTSTTTVQYRFDNRNANIHDDNFLSIWEKLELALQGEDLRVNARVDGFVPFFDDNCDREIDSCFLEFDLRLERFGVHYDSGDLTVDAVDSYAVLGRGIALSLRRVDLLGVDNTLRGGQAVYDNGDVFIRGLGGAVNPQNLDPQTLQIISQPRDQLRGDLFSDPRRHDFIAGGEAGYRLKGVSMGVHGMRVWMGDDDLGNRRDIDVFGWRIDAPALMGGNLAFYGEVNGLRRRTMRPNGDEDVDTGRAIYGTVQANLGNLALLLEFKDYLNYRVAHTNAEDNAWRVYSAAPTLERDAERLEGGALFNARGGRAQVDYGFLPGAWSLNVNALAYAYVEGPPGVTVNPVDGLLVTHGYAKVQRVPSGAGGVDWSFAMELGARRETYLEPADGLESGDVRLRVIHGLIEGGIVAGQHSIEFLVDHRSEYVRKFDYVDFIRGSASLTYSYAGRFRISPVLAWNTEQASRPSLYPGGEIRIDFLEGSFVRIFGGRTPGGLVCSGGVCRDVPPFEGGLAEVVLRL